MEPISARGACASSLGAAVQAGVTRVTSAASRLGDCQVDPDSMALHQDTLHVLTSCAGEEDHREAEGSSEESSAGSGDDACAKARPLGPLIFRASVAGLALVVVASVGALAYGYAGGLAGSRASRSDSVGEDKALRMMTDTACVNAQGWTDGDANCLGDGCTSAGRTCDAFQAHPEWCDDEDRTGQAHNYPELNCCACGGGQVPGPSPSGGEPEVANVHAASTDNDGVATSEPETGGACVDRPRWTNGYIACRNQLGDEDGCTFGGLNCDGYVKQGFCKDGKVVPGMEHTLGGMYNHPEIHCCACGKIQGSVANVIW